MVLERPFHFREGISTVLILTLALGSVVEAHHFVYSDFSHASPDEFVFHGAASLSSDRLVLSGMPSNHSGNGEEPLMDDGIGVVWHKALHTVLSGFEMTFTFESSIEADIEEETNREETKKKVQKKEQLLRHGKSTSTSSSSFSPSISTSTSGREEDSEVPHEGFAWVVQGAGEDSVPSGVSIGLQGLEDAVGIAVDLTDRSIGVFTGGMAALCWGDRSMLARKLLPDGFELGTVRVVYKPEDKLVQIWIGEVDDGHAKTLLMQVVLDVRASLGLPDQGAWTGFTAFASGESSVALTSWTYGGQPYLMSKDFAGIFVLILALTLTPGGILLTLRRFSQWRSPTYKDPSKGLGESDVAIPLEDLPDSASVYWKNDDVRSLGSKWRKPRPATLTSVTASKRVLSSTVSVSSMRATKPPKLMSDAEDSTDETAPVALQPPQWENSAQEPPAHPRAIERQRRSGGSRKGHRGPRKRSKRSLKRRSADKLAQKGPADASEVTAPPPAGPPPDPPVLHEDPPAPDPPSST